MTIPIHPVFKEFLKSLNSSGVEYLVIDGYAVGFHGHPRPTGDFEGVPAPVIGLDDLIANKKASGRHKDLADVEELG